MKTPVLALAIATAAFAGSSLYLWSQLREERARAAQVEDATRKLNERVAELEKARTPFSSQVVNGNRLSAAGGASPASNATRPKTPDCSTNVSALIAWSSARWLKSWQSPG